MSIIPPNIPRVHLADLPTPLHEAKNLTKALGGPRIIIKRDDQMRFAMAGNKVRKLEFLLGDAMEAGAETIITLGSAQSNHCSQTAAACARLGLNCELVLVGEKPKNPNGNVLLDTLFGARIHWAGSRAREDVFAQKIKEARSRGEAVYPIILGGSNGVGAVGYALAMEELQAQAEKHDLAFNRIIIATSSGGTQAGLVVGARATGFSGEILGINNDVHGGPETYEEHLANIANAAAKRIGTVPQFATDDFTVVNDYLGEGYGIVGDAEREAVKLVAETEAILFDPVYAVKSVVALKDVVAKGIIEKDETILLWHTGGAPALFDYAEDILSA